MLLLRIGETTCSYQGSQAARSGPIFSHFAGVFGAVDFGIQTAASMHLQLAEALLVDLRSLCGVRGRVGYLRTKPEPPPALHVLTRAVALMTVDLCRCRRRIAARLAAVVVPLGVLLPTPARAWIYPEHRDITAYALDGLPKLEKSFFEDLWAAARTGNEERYCPKVVVGDGRIEPSCIDLAAWPAIAADHACSPYELVHAVLPSRWIMKVARIAAQTKIALENAQDREQAFNRWTSSNFKLQIADPAYASRASANSGHFLIPRTSNELHDYLARVVEPNVEPNALGLYAYYHLAAVALAAAMGNGRRARSKPELARTILATEAFAVHFLEDILAAGHVAGSWGKVAERKGTHDYYSEFGLDTSSWNGARFTALGDAHLRDQDLKPNAAIVMASLSQVFEAATDPYFERRNALGESASSCCV